MPTQHVELDGRIYQKLVDLQGDGENFSEVINRLLHNYEKHQAMTSDEIMPTSIDIANFLNRKF